MKKDVSYADLYRAYVTENRTKKAVAAQFGVGQDTVAIWLRKHKISRPTKTELILAAWDGRCSTADVAAKLGVSQAMVAHVVRTQNLISYQEPTLSEHALRLGLEEGLSLSAIARLQGVSVCHVSRRAKRLGLKSAHVSGRLPIDAASLVRLYDSGRSLLSLAAEFSTNIGTIKRHLKHAGAQPHTHRPATKLPPEKEAEVILGYESGETPVQIAKRLGVSRSTVQRVLEAQGVYRRRTHIPQLQDKEWLAATYHKGASAIKIANQLGCHFGLVYSALRRFGIARDNTYSRSRYQQFLNAVWLREQYAQHSVATIARQVGCGIGTVTYFLRKHGIEIRSLDAQRALIERTVTERFGWLWTGIAKSECSTGYYDKVGSRLYLHSRAERHKAEALQADRSVTKFRRGPRTEVRDLIGRVHSYSPDFEVWGAQHKVIEVKPFNRLQAKLTPEQLSRMYHQFWCGRTAFGDEYEVHYERSRWTPGEVLGAMTDQDRYFAYNYADWFATAEQLAEFLQRVGWNGFQLSRTDLSARLHRFLRSVIRPADEVFDNMVPAAIVDLLWHFHAEVVFRSWYWKCISIVEAFERPDLLHRACVRLYSSQRKQRVWLKSLLHELSRAGAVLLSQFKPHIAASLIASYCPPGGLVVDPCAGWGARFLGAIRAGVNYLGLDINPQTVNNNQCLAAYCRTDTQFRCQDCRADWGVEQCDLVFTSPPYDDTEVYYGYPEGYKPDTASLVEGIFAQARKCLTKTGLVALNLPVWAEEATLRAAQQHRFELRTRHKLLTSQIAFRGSKFEWIFVFAAS